jgi:hypothetical protein
MLPLLKHSYDFLKTACKTPRHVFSKQPVRVLLSTVIIVLSFLGSPLTHATESIARQWNEELLSAIRADFARPTVHARNLFHTSVAMWDAWAAYDNQARTYLHHERATSSNLTNARNETISYAAYQVLKHRFANSPGAATVLPSLNTKMTSLGYDIGFIGTEGNSPAALGNRIAATIIAFSSNDGANEANDYANRFYTSINDGLSPTAAGNPNISNPNRWQSLLFTISESSSGTTFIDQSGRFPPLTLVRETTTTTERSFVTPFLSPEWGAVRPFALSKNDLTVYQRDDFGYKVFHDPGTPPQFGGADDAEYRAGFEQVLEWSGLLDPADGVMIDISPNARGNNTLGTNDGSGHTQNPVTGAAYTPQMVPAADYYRVLAEFWADGPDSETPPGHWFAIANYVSDHAAVVKKIAGYGPVVDDLEWDVKLYIALAGAMHDSAVAAWGAKGWYDYVRPISALRYMAGFGQSSDPSGPSYHPNGIALAANRVEVVTTASVAAGERHEHLGAGSIGKIAAYAWRGPEAITDPATDVAGVGWILVENWWPYQRPTFITPPFAGYVSGHSTFSRAAAEIMTAFTGDEFFPGGLGEFLAPQNSFLVFEDGPSVDITLQWATYRDASDETSISRIYGGIHPRADDIPGRLMGHQIAQDAFDKASALYATDIDADGLPDYYEAKYSFLDYNNATDALLDQDNDGYSNLREYRAVSNPESADSRPSQSAGWLPKLILQ